MNNLILGDCLEMMSKIENNSVDSIVTDPPYGLSFMGKEWDYDVPSKEIWCEVLRVLKPGGHLLSFGGTRTYHRMVVNIEDAGFEIRDQIQWIYGSGFPKSKNLKDEWQGWGTSLKPANEPICLARKPLDEGLTVSENVLKWGVGALNIDGSRIEIDFNCGGRESGKNTIQKTSGIGFTGNKKDTQETPLYNTQGRWPANVLFDETSAKMLDDQTGVLKNGGQNKSSKRETWLRQETKPTRFAGDSGGASRFFYCAKASKSERNAGINGAEAPAVNHHPTVKPIRLMEYLIKLITPLNGMVLDPFMGSGSTGVACKNLNRKFIGIEKDEKYFEIAKQRIEK